MGGAIGEPGEPGVVEKIEAVHGLAQPAEVRIGSGDDAHELVVARRIVVERRRVREPVALPAADRPQALVRRQRPLQDAQDGSVQGGVDHRTAAPRTRRRVQRGDRGMRGEHAGEVVRDRDADAHRRAIGIAGEMQQPAVADPDAVEAGPRRVRAVLAEHRDAHGDEPVGKAVRSDVPLLERARAEVLDDDVGRRCEPPQDVLALVRAQVEGDALAAAALDRPEQGVAVDERPDLAHEVAAARLFDLDDLRPLLTEQACAERRGDSRSQIEDPDALERTGHEQLFTVGLVPSYRIHAAGPAALRSWRAR